MSGRSNPEEMRREFDLSFREPRGQHARAPDHFLAVRIGGDPFAIRVADINGLFADRNIVPIPSSRPALLGLARFKSEIAPVFDLRALLGYPPGESARWMVLVDRPALTGLSFDLFEAHVGGTGSGDTIDTGGILRPIVAIRAIVERLEKEP